MFLLYNLRGLFVCFLKFNAFTRAWYFVLKQNFNNKRSF
ncbi:hypothetical protein HPHPH10_0911 [Helicobacter pylori Hp H-10]|nr:hypothetical protein HPHPH10_0911 [Helicobacter pylori Hp H-10]